MNENDSTRREIDWKEVEEQQSTPIPAGAFNGEFGATESTAQAARSYAESKDRMTYFTKLLENGEFETARQFAESQGKIGNKIYDVLLTRELAARRQIARP